MATKTEEFDGMPVRDRLVVVRSEGWVTVLCGRVMLARFEDGDLGLRNVVLVSLTHTTFECRDVAAAFGLSATYVSTLRGRVRDEGSAGLLRDRGRPSRIGAEGEAMALKMVARNKTQAEIAVGLGVDASTVSRLLKRLGSGADECEAEQLPLPDFDDEDAGDVDGVNDGAGDVDGVNDGAGDVDGVGNGVAGVRRCRYAGAMLALSFLDRVGFAGVFKMAARAGYRFDSCDVLVGTVMGLLLGAGNIEGFKHLARRDVGALVGIDRFPTTRTLRAHLGVLGDAADAVDLQTRLARALLALDGPDIDVFFVDDPFVTYSGRAPLAKGWNNKKSRAEHGRGDTWVTDFHGRPLVCVSGEPSGLSTGLAAIIGPLRKVVGDGARPLLAFDRGGSYPATFAELNKAGWDWVAYRRCPLASCGAAPKLSWFALDGVRHSYRCADETVELDGYGPARQITLFEAGEPVAQVLTSVTAGVTARVLHLLRCRWRIENAFKYLADNHGINWLCDYAKTTKTITIETVNPARVAANKAVAAREADLIDAKTRLADISTTPLTDVKARIAALGNARDDIVYAKDELAAAKAHRKTVPAKLHPEVTRAEPRLARRALQTALRICAHNAEHWLARQLDTHLQNPDEIRALTRALMHQPGTIDYQPDHITVTLDTADQPRLTRAIHALTNQLNHQPAHLPGDPRPITYTIKPNP